jgi:hypothetical protein
MLRNETLNAPQIEAERGRLLVRCPWRAAEGLQTHLRRRGIHSTLCLEPWDKIARLEVWPGPTEAALRQALADWPS